MRNLNNMNDLHNAQDVTLLLEILEDHSNSPSSTNGKIIQLFEKTFTGGFSCVNTRVAFETEILLLNFSQKYFNKLNIDESFKL